MRGLSRGAYAIAKTKRRRFLWCAWWTGELSAKPFRAPDAWGGGARTEEEAKALAERAAGQPLEMVNGHWAGAWKRILAGRPPFPSEEAKGRGRGRGIGIEVSPANPFSILGVDPSASLEELKFAFRKKALEHHPDQGGDGHEFILIKRAYDRLVERRTRHRA